MSEGTITLGPVGSTHKYAVTKIQQDGVPDLSPPTRQIGVQRRIDNPNVNKVSWASWTRYGIGWQRMHRETGYGVGGMRDANANTLHHSAVTPGILHESQTHTDPLDHLVRYASFKSDLWGLFEEDYKSGAITSIAVAKFGATSDDWQSPHLPKINDSTSDTQSSGATMTVNHTVQSTYSNRVSIAIVMTESAGTDPTGVTEAGNAMTKLDSANDGGRNVSIWYIAAPTTGAQDYVASGTSGETVMTVVDIYHAPQSSIFRTVTKTTGTDTSSSLTPTSVAGDLVIGAVARQSGNEDTTSGAGQTELVDTFVSGDLIGTVSWERGTDGASTTTHSYSWTSSGSFATIAVAVKGTGVVGYTTAATAGIRGFDIAVHKSNLWVVGSSGINEQRYMVWKSTDGAGWGEADGTGWPTGNLLSTTTTRRNLFSDDGARICPFGNTLLVAVYDETNGEIEVYYSTDSGANWSAGAVIPSGSGPKSFIVAPDPTTAGNPPTPTLVTAEGIYRVDSGGATFDRYFDFDGNAQNGRWAVYGTDGAIWSPISTGAILRYEITGQNSRSVSFVYPPDGLVSARRGYANMLLAPTAPYLVVAYGGSAASRQGSVFFIDYQYVVEPTTGERYWPWHSMYLESDANLDLHAVGYSTEDDSTPRLHFALEGAATAEMYHLEEPFTDPSSGVTMKFQSTWYVELAEDDMGDPHADSLVLNLKVDADSLDTVATIEAGSGTSNHIGVEYGINGAAWNDNAETEATFPGYFASDDKTLYLGKTRQNDPNGAEGGTPFGISAKTARWRMVGKRDGTNTNYVALKEFQIEYVNKNLTLDSWLVTVDLAKSAEVDGVKLAAVITNLETARQAVPMLQFDMGLASSKYVTMDSESLAINLEPMAGGARSNQQVTGTATFRLKELQR